MRKRILQTLRKCHKCHSPLEVKGKILTKKLAKKAEPRLIQTSNGSLIAALTKYPKSTPDNRIHSLVRAGKNSVPANFAGYNYQKYHFPFLVTRPLSLSVCAVINSQIELGDVTETNCT